MKKLYQLIVVLSVMYAGLAGVYAQTTILDHSLLTQESFGAFIKESVAGTQNWYFNQQYGAMVSGYSNGQSFANEDWLISPVMNLENADDVKLSFDHTRGSAAVMNVGVNEGWYKVYATANYTNNPATTTWVELTGVNQNVTTAWQYISSGELTIPEAAKSQSSRVAFRYISSATASATWEVKNVKVTGDVQGTNPGSGGTFKITNWNTEWLGCTEFGPDDEAGQLNKVVTALQSMNSDIYCLQEVTNTTATRTVEDIVSALGSTEWGGAIVELTEDCTQRQVLIYKKARVQFVSSFALGSGASYQGNSYYYNWSSGRFPAVYNVNFISGTNVVPVTLVNIHAKAEDGNASSYTRRLGGSIGLKGILDGLSYNAKNLVIIGDYNDYLEGTTSDACACTDSPYKNFVDDAANYTALTANFASPIIENIIVSNELADNYVAGSVSRQTNMTQLIPGFYNNTSNHLPVSASFQFATMSTPAFAVNNLWTLYPNPVKDVLNVKADDTLQDTDMYIYDVAGRQVLAGKLSAAGINVTALPAGIYFLKMDGKTGKFIKE